MHAPAHTDPTSGLGFRHLWWHALGSTFGQLLALAAVVAFFAVADHLQADGGSFLTQRNLRTVSVQTATTAVAALGMTMIIVAGGIDLSAGTALALSATVLAWFLKENYPPWIAVLLGIGAGGVTGFINGQLVSTLRVVPFIVTLGTMTLYLGAAKKIADETTVRPDVIKQVPLWLRNLLSTQAEALWPYTLFYGGSAPPRPTSDLPLAERLTQWISFPLGVWLTLLLALVLSAVLRYTVFGRYIFALGSNEATARLCGVPIATTKVAVYTLAGLFVGVAGMYQFARLSSGNPTSGTGKELEIIAAVVIGGGSLSGGRGTVLGTLTGALIMAVIRSGCTQLGLTNPVQDIILGVIIIAAVRVDQLRQRGLRD